jgi:RNA polymerase sigma-70 factor, ECF subfamily
MAAPRGDTFLLERGYTVVCPRSAGATVSPGIPRTIARLSVGVDVASLYVRYGPLVYRRCLRLLKSEAEAEDAMQDVFVRVIGRAAQLEDGGLSSLLFQMATQVSLNRLLSRRRHPETPDDALLLELADQGARADRALAAHWLARLFAGERPDTATMAVLHFVDGMTLEEVAVATKLSVSGVRKRLRGLSARAQGQLAGAAPEAP